MLVVALLIAVFSWQRNAYVQEKQLEHTTSQLVQTLKSQMGTYDALLRSLGDELVYRGALDSETNREFSSDYLARVQDTHAGIAGLGFLDLDGNYLAGSTPDTPVSLPNLLESEQTADSFRAMLDNPDFQIVQPYYFGPLDEWLIPLRAPIFDENGELVAVMAAGIRASGVDAPWGNISPEGDMEIALIRDDGYLNYLYPVPEARDRMNRVYGSPVTEKLQRLVHNNTGMVVYDRPYDSVENTVRTYLWIEPVEEYGLTAVAMKLQSDVLAAWGRSMVLPMAIWLASLIALGFGYRRAVALLERAELDTNQTRNELEKALERYNKLTRLIPIGVYQLEAHPNGHRRFMYFSDRACKVLGLSGNESLEEVKSSVYAAFHPEDRMDFRRRESDAITNMEPLRWEGRVIVNGEVRWINLQADPGEVLSNGRTLWNGVVIDFTEKQLAQQQINTLAYYDPLTHLPNRRLLYKRIQQAVNEVEQNHHSSALMFIDIDNFKALNDTLGQATGDKILKVLADRLRRSIRERDTVAHMGADEFVVLHSRLPKDQQEAARQVRLLVDRINAELEREINVEGQKYIATVSMGISVFSDGNVTAEQLLQQSEQAMYQAKDAGRNKQIFFDETLQEVITDRLALKRDLRSAILNDELELYYQLQVDQNGEPMGAEALVRWHHPERGLVMPDQFIEVAEQSGDIVLLGESLLCQACKQLVLWQKDDMMCNWSMAVNISANHLKAENFEQSVLTIIKETGAPADKLILEITESMLLAETNSAIQKMNALREHGIKFALDDFGTGYSSLSYLAQLPLNEIKIDRSFVMGLSESADKKDLIKTMISLGHSMSLKLVAEGVETEEQFLWLKESGCTIFQGFWIGRPLPASEVKSQVLLFKQMGKVKTTES